MQETYVIDVLELKQAMLAGYWGSSHSNQETGIWDLRTEPRTKHEKLIDFRLSQNEIKQKYARPPVPYQFSRV